MACGETKNNCGEKRYATCVYYQNDVPDWSSLSEEKCIVIEETTKDLYDKTTELISLINVSDIESECDKLIIKKEDGKVTIKSLLETYKEALETLLCVTPSVEKGTDMDISSWDIDISCFKDICSEPVTRLSELVKSITDKVCNRCLDIDKITSSKIYTTVPDVIVIESTGTAVVVTLPAVFCKSVKIRVKGLSYGSYTTNTIDGVVGRSFNNDTTTELIYDGSEIITI